MTATSDIAGYVRRVSAEARSAPAAVAALAYDVLARQAEARTLFAGKEFVEARAAAHHVDREAAELPSGNVLDVLGRGPSTDLERALLIGLAFRALDARIGDEGPEAAARFVRQADWLEVGVGQPVYAFVDEALPRASAAVFWSTVAKEVLAADDQTSVSRAKNAVRIAALAASGSEAARNALTRVLDARDPATRALAESMGEARATSHDRHRIEGRASRPRPRGVRGALRLVTGVALAMWLARLLGRAIGLRRRAHATLGATGVTIDEELGWLGKRVRASSRVVALDAILGIQTTARYGGATSLAGALALAIGVWAGGVTMVDGARTGETFLLLAGAAMVAAGAALDLVFDVLLPARRARSRVELTFRDGSGIAIEDVPEDEANAFVRSLER